jgi:hypothetical protein
MSYYGFHVVAKVSVSRRREDRLQKKHAFHVDERRVHFESCRFAYTKQPLLGDLIAQC